ncbi:MAG TPA: nuclear transport factor 2 family protein [Kofleriaceae bacterium]|nr:nuclear transport factor 2 family protein [Kofleriaceae bacterium]
MPATEELRRLALEWNRAWNSRDPSRLARFFAPGSTFSEPSLAGPMDGAEGVAASATKTWSEWPRAVFESVSVTVEGARVVIEWRTSATHKTGLEHVLEGVDVLEVSQGLVTSCRSYYDTRTHTPDPARRRRAPR